ncbi:uncharacterized protein MONBRDRAFT_26455 [Monosiga brevicollis MX1]|uniref:RING-type domain-containing protein n=1 Tax=Monosiga brevicollis TaxID=81824 RepID=A9V2E9_MONBE|nr:uncharacterized protein MONBRDRAFT_26455 [Monosiga brevicollis MX1]EDQ88245.1 predicted protein [Monosiga brevicollis MX1]|eukprot:XP_001746838.1 hypothetical protein [Monosiga brevicollis MX1]
MAHKRSMSIVAQVPETQQLLFSSPVPAALRCPLCERVFQDPVIAIDCGHSFCQECLSDAADQGLCCPRDADSKLDATRVIPNKAIADQIRELHVYCPNCECVPASREEMAKSDTHNRLIYDAAGQPVGMVANSGCTYCTSVAEVPQHLTNCAFMPVPCPNAAECGLIPAHRLNAHISICPHTPCRYAGFGCTFRSTPEEVAQHSNQACEYGDEPLARQGRLLQSLVETADQLTVLVESLHAKAMDLEARQEDLAQGKPHPLTLSRRPSVGAGARARALPPNRAGWGAEQYERTGVGPTNHDGPAVGDGRPTMPLWMQEAQAKFGRADADDLLDSWHDDRYHRISAVHRPSVEVSMHKQHLKPHNHGLGRVALPNGQELELPFNYQCDGTLRAHLGPVWCIECYEDLMFSAGSDETDIHVWDLAPREPKRLRLLQGHQAMVHSLHVRDNRLFSGDEARLVRVWDLETFECLLSFEACRHIVSTLVSAQNLLIAGSYASMAVWNIDSKRRHTVVTQGLTHWIRAMCVTEDERYLFTATHDLIKAWEVPDFTEACKIKTNYGSIHSMTLTPRHIIIGTYNRHIHIYSIRDQQHVLELKGHLGTVHSLAVSISGRFLFSASLDQTTKVWDLEKQGLIIQSLNRHDASVNVLKWSGNRLLTGSADCTIKLYHAYQGPAEVVDRKQDVNEIGNFQACWGGGKLPGIPVVMTGGKSEPPVDSHPLMHSLNSSDSRTPVPSIASNEAPATISNMTTPTSTANFALDLGRGDMPGLEDGQGSRRALGATGSLEHRMLGSSTPPTRLSALARGEPRAMSPSFRPVDLRSTRSEQPSHLSLDSSSLAAEDDTELEGSSPGSHRRWPVIRPDGTRDSPPVGMAGPATVGSEENIVDTIGTPSSTTARIRHVVLLDPTSPEEATLEKSAGTKGSPMTPGLLDVQAVRQHRSNSQETVHTVRSDSSYTTAAAGSTAQPKWVLKSKTASAHRKGSPTHRPPPLNLAGISHTRGPSSATLPGGPETPRAAGPFAIGPQPTQAGNLVIPAGAGHTLDSGHTGSGFALPVRPSPSNGAAVSPHPILPAGANAVQANGNTPYAFGPIHNGYVNGGGGSSSEGTDTRSDTRPVSMVSTRSDQSVRQIYVAPVGPPRARGSGSIGGGGVYGDEPPSPAAMSHTDSVRSLVIYDEPTMAMDSSIFNYNFGSPMSLRDQLKSLPRDHNEALTPSPTEDAPGSPLFVMGGAPEEPLSPSGVHFDVADVDESHSMV